MKREIRVLQYGLGPIGTETAKLVCRRPGLRLVGAVDIDPDKVGRNLGELLGLDAAAEGVVSERAQSVLRDAKPDVVLHTTGSFLQQVEDQLRLCIEAGASVISSCEELFYPFRRHPELSKRIDHLARLHKVTVLGTGVNPGFSMDVLVLTLCSVCTDVERVFARRVVDASRRRLSLQKKVGAGLTPEKFRALTQEHKLGHVGLVESLHAVADRLGLVFDRVDEKIEAKIADAEVVTPHLTVRPGEVAGIVHTATAVRGNEERVKLELQMYVGARRETDFVQIEGTPPLEMEIKNGIFGDQATVARMVNAIPVVLRAQPGLVTALDVGVPACFTEVETL
ncbi:MAG: dihydrodipicolinate reductase [Calditrichaeota bacterium]|nr:MAG: dihydrodipicolinate reductase [Calditrichota bacterium]